MQDGQIAMTGVPLIGIVFNSLHERICALDRDGAIILTNEAWNRFAIDNGGDPKACGIGANYLRLCRSAKGAFSECALEAALGIDAVLSGDSSQFTLDYPCHSPSHKAWYRLAVRPLRPPQPGVLVVHSEITNHARAKQRLRRVEAQFGALWENSLHVATVMAADGVVQYQSPASERVLGVTAETMVGHSIFDFVHTDDCNRIRKLMRACQRYPHLKHSCIYRLRNPGGSWRIVESTASNRMAQGNRGIILNSRDLSSRNESEQALTEAQNALRRDLQDLEDLTSRLFRKQDEDRRRMAGEVNGALSRRLGTLSLHAAHLTSSVDLAAQARALIDSIAGLETELRQLSSELYPPMLEHFGLAVALRSYCTEFEQKKGITVSYTHRGISTSIPTLIAAALYHVAEQALDNIAEHAQARHAWVNLSRGAKGIRLSVRDGGVGFSPSLPEGPGLGILAMRERLRAVKGSLSIRSSPGHGTEVTAVCSMAAGNQASAAVAGDVVIDPLDQD